MRASLPGEPSSSSAVPSTVPAALAATALRRPDREALVDGDVRLTWSQLHDQVQTLARFFLTEGVRPGDRVAVQAPNTWHWVVSALGALSLGATLIPVSTRFTGHEALDVLTRSRASALVVADEFLGVDRLAELREAGLLAEGSGSGPSTILRVPMPGRETRDGIAWSEIARRAEGVPVEKAEVHTEAVRPDQISDVLFTSGTTGRSKGVMSAHEQALDIAAAWAGHAGLTEHDRYLVINPFFHSFGYKAGILACVVSGATILPLSVFDVEQALRLIERERITVLPGAPTLYRSILDHPSRADHDLSSLRVAVTGAASVPVALVEEMRRELSFDSVLTAYGLTEAVMATMCRPGDDPTVVARTCGRATAGFEIRIDSASGEVLLRGPNVMRGYLDDPVATRETIDADGWLHTGDIGTLDRNGYLTITDRLKDMYICGGFNVYPAEVEQALAHLEGVGESAVIGVPDERLGEVGKAFIVPRPGVTLRVQDVLAFCKSRLAGYKVPRQVEFRTELPRNASGKVLKTELRAASHR
ncbi:FadD3 family acyl-CoA ligase [Pseudonocardia spinosispora]|uniref:FadD3 family acyl-CoA ligase n=1 Tax=Pseudonocardia spinosispora TaxID=103441 RepID=UPI0003FC3334|nr:FadD3 family acyl-CoA ligase [Pseudonocardia spinosispora]